MRTHLLATALTGLALAAGCAGSDDDDSASAKRSPAAAEETETIEREVRSEADAEAAPAGARAGTGRVRLLRLGNFNSPTYLTAPRGERRRRFVVERGGTIRVVRDGKVLRRPFLDISGNVLTEGESGLLSMAFAPDYARSGRFYVYYVDRRGAGHIRIEEYRRSRGSADRALPGSRRLVLTLPHQRSNHKGGQLQFGPDRRLYAAFGDGGGGGDPDRAGQDLGKLPAKMIRIDPRPSGGRGYRIPRDNPFRGRGGARPEIYAYGLRNPYRFSFDRLRGHLTIADVGQDAVEEIDFVPNTRGRRRAPRGGYNFGWNAFEGRSRFSDTRAPGHVPPVVTHNQGEGFCSIIGGYVLRDRSLGSRLYGRYVYGDLCSPGLRVAALRRGNAPSRALGARVDQLVSFGEDGRGRVYAVSLGGGVYRLAPG
jgi:glucose/arabinose dehydrogenase